jgi:predicted acyl esterase
MRVLLALLALGLLPASAEATISARGSVEQVQVTGAHNGARLTLTRNGRRVAQQKAGSLGGAVFRGVAPGAGYRINGGRRFRVMPDRSAPPSSRVYQQRIPKSGYGYLTTRDGTKLAVDVRLPAGPGPYPTLVEYAGYGFANPAGAEAGISPVANLLGFAVVDVNMRGTGCSGGAFDYFEPLQGLDGYDVIETVARQPWVLGGRVGMVGVSYGGISQLFVAETRPPHLAAITPLSVIDDTQTTLYPGGILNTGFALSWGKDRAHDAEPASKTGGQPWALERIRGGDKVCRANQALHAQAPDLLKKVRDNRYYVPKVADPLAPVKFVHKIKAPVFLACQFTDEQTGGHCPALATRFTGTSRKWFTFTNGVHTDSLDPATFNRWYDFLSLYVARRAPALTQAQRDVAPVVFNSVMGVPDVHLPDDPLQGRASYADALAAFEAVPAVRILFDNGAGGAPGAPFAGFEQSFPAWPATTDQSFDLAGGTFTWEPRGTDFSGSNTGPGGLWTAAPSYHWTPTANALVSTTPPLAANTTVVGTGAVKATITTSVRDVDLQATVSEVRPDGIETYVQSGWLRASRRNGLAKHQVKPLPKGTPTPVTIPLYYQGHAYRAGSRIRVTISAPGGDQPTWAFAETVPAKPGAQVAISDSSLTLPVVPGVAVPTPLPPCPGLRGEPCRT